MWFPLLVSSIGAGVLATTVMLPLFYLPRVWGRAGYDVIGALGSALTGAINARARLVGGLTFYLGGVVFAAVYGLLAYALVVFAPANGAPPEGAGYTLPFATGAAFPILGFALGLAHGGVVALFVTILVVEHHPLTRYREGMELLFPTIIAHPVFGVAVMMTHRLILESWL